MSRQYRPPRRAGGGAPGPGSGGGQVVTVPSPAVTAAGSSTAISIPNFGFTDLSAAISTEYVLDAPDAGVRKTIFCGSSTTNARVLHLSTGKTVSCDLAGSMTMTFTTTVDVIVEMYGVSSTRWTCMFYPPASTAGTVVLTTT